MPHWQIAVQRLQQLKEDLGKIAGNEMVNDALDNIRAERDINGAPMKPRKPGTRRNSGRSLLVDTSRGRRSIRHKEENTRVKLLGEEYMVAHNEGVNRTVSARSRRGKSFTRRMNLPKREYAGDSPKLRSRINKIVANRIVRALT